MNSFSNDLVKETVVDSLGCTQSKEICFFFEKGHFNQCQLSQIALDSHHSIVL